MTPPRSFSLLPRKQDAYLSNNEIENLCLKAARGAGMSWGLAEEAGFAAAWLATRNLDGPGALLAQIQKAEACLWRDVRPVISPGQFRAPDGGCLCPIALGATLYDYAHLLEISPGSGSLQLGPVSFPILLMPFLSDLAQMLGVNFHLKWPRGICLISMNGGISGDLNILAQETEIVALLPVTTMTADLQLEENTPLFVSSATQSALNEFALRTTVPASAASRADAGAASGDND